MRVAPLLCVEAPRFVWVGAHRAFRFPLSPHLAPQGGAGTVPVFAIDRVDLRFPGVLVWAGVHHTRARAGFPSQARAMAHLHPHRLNRNFMNNTPIGRPLFGCSWGEVGYCGARRGARVFPPHD